MYQDHHHNYMACILFKLKADPNCSFGLKYIVVEVAAVAQFLTAYVLNAVGCVWGDRRTNMKLYALV